MENLNDYSNYVIAAYLATSLATAAFALFVVAKYFYVKSKIKNEKSA